MNFLDRSLVCYHTALVLLPSLLPALYSLGMVREQLENFKSAEGVLRVEEQEESVCAAGLLPALPPSPWPLASVLQDPGRHQQEERGSSQVPGQLLF